MGKIKDYLTYIEIFETLCPEESLRKKGSWDVNLIRLYGQTIQWNTSEKYSTVNVATIKGIINQ